MRNSEHAIHGAHRAADAGADRAAHDRADRTRRAVAFTGAFLRAADNTLRMAEMGYASRASTRAAAAR